MKIDIKSLLEGKATKIGNEEYLSAKDYVQPFIDKVSKLTNDFRIQVKIPNQVSFTKDDISRLTDIVFNRVWIQAILPKEISIPDCKEVIGFIYGLNTKIPIAKFYKALLNTKNGNLIIFDRSVINAQNIIPQTKINYSCIDSLLDKQLDTIRGYKMLSGINILTDNGSINEYLGKWIRKTILFSNYTDYGKIKLSTDVPINAYKELYENYSSPYFIGDRDVCGKGAPTMMDIYNAFSWVISVQDTKDIINKPEKILLLKNILNINIL